MIKKINYLAVCLISAGLLSSCTLSHTCVVTNNPVGSKRGVLKNSDLNILEQGITFEKAMKNGNIKKASIAEFKHTNLVIANRITLTVTGE